MIHFLAFDISEKFHDGNGNRNRDYWYREEMGMGENGNRNSLSRTPLFGYHIEMRSEAATLPIINDTFPPNNYQQTINDIGIFVTIVSRFQ